MAELSQQIESPAERSPRRFRITLAARLLLTLSAVAGLSTIISLSVHQRALARDLEFAADQRLANLTHAADVLIEAHLLAVQARYQAGLATLDGRPLPELARYAGELRSREEAVLILVLDASGRVLTQAGDPTFLPLAELEPKPTLGVQAGSAFFVTSAQPSEPNESVARIVAINRIEPAVFAAWSELCGGTITLRDPSLAREGGLARVVRSVGRLELVVEPSLEAGQIALENSRTNLLNAGGIALLVSLLACFALARSFLRPMLSIRRAAERIREGSLDVAVGVESKDEIGDVSRAFDLMLASLRDSKRQEAVYVAELRRSREHLANAQEVACIGSFEVDLGALFELD